MKATTDDARRLFHEGQLALVDLEHRGMMIDVPYLERMIAKTAKKLTRLEAELKEDPIWGTWQKTFDRPSLGSRDQLSKILFDVMGIPNVGYTPSSTEDHIRYRADEEAFEDIDLPFVKKYMEVEKLKKVRTTYLLGIQKELEPDGRIHPSFWLSGGGQGDEKGGARSFRSSCSDPNVMNQPSRNPKYTEIVRRCFIAPPGYVLAEMDYSAIEVCCAAANTKDKVLIDYICDKTKDMHRDLACQIFMLKPEEVSKPCRYIGKNGFVFPSFYGSFYAQIAPRMWSAVDKMKLALVDGTSLRDHLTKKGIKKLGACDPSKPPLTGTFEKHVKEVENDFWNNRFVGYRNWKKKYWEDYLHNGWFQILTGFVIDQYHKRKEVLNIPNQSVAFHCDLWSLIEGNKWLRKQKMKSRIICEIHDSLLLEVWIPELQDVLRKFAEIMTVDLPKAWDWINVPLSVECEVAPEGGSWFDKEKVKL